MSGYQAAATNSPELNCVVCVKFSGRKYWLSNSSSGIESTTMTQNKFEAEPVSYATAKAQSSGIIKLLLQAKPNHTVDMYDIYVDKYYTNDILERLERVDRQEQINPRCPKCDSMNFEIIDSPAPLGRAVYECQDCEHFEEMDLEYA